MSPVCVDKNGHPIHVGSVVRTTYSQPPWKFDPWWDVFTVRHIRYTWSSGRDTMHFGVMGDGYSIPASHAEVVHPSQCVTCDDYFYGDDCNGNCRNLCQNCIYHRHDLNSEWWSKARSEDIRFYLELPNE